jgi:hypothetical protein
LDKGVFTCLESCPNVTKALTPVDYICAYNVTPTIENYVQMVSQGICAAYAIKSEPVLGRCIPVEGLPLAISNTTTTTNSTDLSVATMQNLLSSGSSFTMQSISDISTTWPVIAAGAGIAMIFTMLWMFLLQWVAGIFVWLIIIMANIVFILGSVWLYFYWQLKLAVLNNQTYVLSSNTYFKQATIFAGLDQGYATAYQVDVLMYAFYVVAVLAGLLLLITLVLIKRIVIAVAVLKEASKAMMKMKTIGKPF